MREYLGSITGYISRIDRDLADIIRKNIVPIMWNASGELAKERMPLPHPSTMHFLDPSTKASDYMYEFIYGDDASPDSLWDTLNNNEKLAELITDIVGSILEEYDYEYWTYPESEYQKAIDKYNENHKRYIEMFVKCWLR